LEQDDNVESNEGDLELPPSEEAAEKESVKKEEPEKDMDDLDSEDLELNLELDDDEDTKK